MTKRLPSAQRRFAEDYFSRAAVLGLCFSLAASWSVKAGDILRGGASAGSRPSVGPAGPARDALADQARGNAQDALARTTQAVQAVKAMQEAARAAAVRGPNNLGARPNGFGPLPAVPNGLKPGGLQVAPGVPKNLAAPSPAEDATLWRGARLPVETKVGPRTVVSVEQLKPQAVLTWETMNVGKETTLRFNQSRGGSEKNTWIAVNKVVDPSGAPSQILGKIEAPGQVYVLNRNGILFGGSSQVNVYSFAASTLPINDNLLNRGLLNNPDAQFLFSALPLAAGAKGTPAFNPTISDPQFKVDAGAPAYTLAEQVALDATNAPVRAPELSFRAANGSKVKLVAGTDYTLAIDAATRKATVTFTAAGLAAVGATPVNVIYTPVVVKSGDVVVQPGARLSSPVSPEGNGGRIILAGSNVTNAGEISTPAGQTILAAGLQVGIDAHASKDPILRGLDVYVGRVSVPPVPGTPTPQAGGGTVTNSGLIDVPRGNASLAGKSIRQLGAIDSTTTVALNGRIDLNASYDARSNTGYNVAVPESGTPFLFESTGRVEIGAGSVMQILPDLADTEKAVGLELALRSQVNLTGRTIHLGTLSMLLAPNADVSLRAGRWVFQGNSSPPTSNFLAAGGQVYLDAGATINVAGSTDGIAAITQNILTLQLRGGELAPSPLQRDGVVRGADLAIDLRNHGEYDGRFWIGTPLGDANGYVGLIERSVAELTSAGGTVSVSAGGSVVMQPGSVVDVSGGFVRYEGGLVKTTRLLSQGVLVDIADATPDRVYDGIYTGQSTFTFPKWGVTETFSSPLAPTGEHFEPAYNHGMDAGTITIKAPSLALDGTLLGKTVPGLRQLRDSPISSSMPKAGTLVIGLQAQDPTPPQFLTTYPSSVEVVFRNGVVPAPVPAFALDVNGEPHELDERRRSVVALSPELLAENGFGSLTVTNEEGRITVPAGVKLITPAGGTLSLTAANIDVRGEVAAPGGELSFTALNLSPFRQKQISLDPNALTPPPAPARGIFTLASGASLSAAGLISDERPGSGADPLVPLAPHGGTITIDAFTAELHPGSAIDVSGGVVATGTGEMHYGDGGHLIIRAGRDPVVSSLLGGKITLGSTLRGFSGAHGASLAIQAPLVQIGGTPRRAETLQLGPEFFSTGGFGSFALTGIGVALDSDGPDVPEVFVAPGTVVDAVAQSFLAIPHPEGVAQLELRPFQNLVGQRTPVSIALQAPGVNEFFGAGGLISRGDILMGEGAVIRTDPLASVAFTGQTVAVLGSVFAPAGAITISGGKNSATIFNDLQRALTTTYLGPRSVLSTAGATIFTPDPFGRRLGEVLPGGSISISGNIVAAAGSVLDVSGTSAIFDLPPPLAMPLDRVTIPANSGINSQLAKLRTVPTQVESDAGSITLEGGQMLFTDATLIGRAGGPSALGGELHISSGRFYAQGVTATPLDPTLEVKQNGHTILRPLPSDGTAIGLPVLGVNGASIQGQGYFAANQFARGGFDSLALDGVVDFRGPIEIAARGELSVATGGVLYADHRVHLSAPYVALGIPFPTPTRPEDVRAPFLDGASPLFVPPTFGPGRLIVDAEMIDVGTLTLQKVGCADFNAVNGDIRGSGILNIAGRLTLRAAQVYPVSASDFRITAYDYAVGGATQRGAVTILGAGTSPFPFSAGGSLSIYASTITQAGTLRAPQGVINLGWDGTGTAPTDLLTGTALPFPVTQRITLATGSYTSVSAIDPATGEGVLIPYGVSPDGNSWIDPRGVDITGGGLREKSISIGGKNIAMQKDSLIDLRGGGDLYAYRWVDGNRGNVDLLGRASDVWSPTQEYQPGALVNFGGHTWSSRVRHTGESPAVNRFWTLVPESYAVVPGFRSRFTPYAPFNSNGTNPLNLIGDSGPGYVDTTLRIGDRIYLNASASLPAGYYTLLPARYALLPGAALITPKTGTPLGTIEFPEGNSFVAGYRFNALDSSRSVPRLASWFEVASSEVLRERAQYEDYTANLFLKNAAKELGIDVPRLPTDSGYLLFQASQAMTLFGKVASPSIAGGRGSAIDITTPSDLATPVDLVLSDSGTGGSAGVIALSVPVLNAFGAESLLIGGRRVRGEDGTSVVVQSGKVTVSKSGAALTAPDLILASQTGVTLDPGARVEASGRVSEHVAGLRLTGDGVLLRVSVDPTAKIFRTVTPSTQPTLSIGAGARVKGESLILDSTGTTVLDPAAILTADYYTLNSGRISIQLDNPGALQPGAGLVLAGVPLENLQSSKSLSLLSYSSLDFYGTGEFGGGLGRLALSAGEIRGFNQGAGAVWIVTGTLDLSNTAAVTGPGPVGVPSGTFAVDANTIRLGTGMVAIDQFSTVELNASRGIFSIGAGGLTTQGALTANTPVLTGAAGSSRTIVAGGALTFIAPPNAAGALAGGLGATISLTGTAVTIGSDILLPSGSLAIRARTGDLLATGRLDVSGTRRDFYDVTRFTDAGEIRLTADAGDVELGADSEVSVAAQPDGGNAGRLIISAANGDFTAGGTLLGKGGFGGRNGTFVLTTGTLATMSTLTTALTAADLTESQSIRIRAGSVTIDSTIKTNHFQLSADAGSITVGADTTIDASGQTGGSIALVANGSVILLGGSKLTVAAEDFNSAGKGGEVRLESGAQTNGVLGSGVVEIQTGSTIDLSVAAKVAGDATTLGSSAYEGKFSGKLHIRAPQNAAFTDVLVNPINGTILDASSILLEGYRLRDLAGTGGVITTAIQNEVRDNGILFLGAAGSPSAGYTTMVSRLLANNAALEPALVIAHGAELFNSAGDITLGTASSTATSDWNLGAIRFGVKRAPGVLTLRAGANLVFFNALSDGFNTSAYDARPLNQVAGLPVNAQSWSYRLAAGADLGAADYGEVKAATLLGANQGFLKLGKNNGNNSSNSNTNGVGNAPGNDALTSAAVANRFQVIRTGSGDIDIAAGRSVQLLNQFATIYTAGTLVTNGTLGGDFNTPSTNQTGGEQSFGANQQPTPYPARFTMAGGNVSIRASENIEHLTSINGGPLIADSGRELPNNWLYRRGYIDPVTGEYGIGRFNDVTTTAWWIDFSNFFQGIGALGGGDVSLVAGGSVSNVDAVVPTNARQPISDGSALLELGGGDLVVRAGRDIDGGVYYVERGHGTLDAGRDITTNSTRSVSLGNLTIDNTILDSRAWLPTTLFLGKGGFDVTARGNLLLGPVANPFLLPVGINNSYWNKTYFSTYAPDSFVNATAIGGTLTLRESAMVSSSLTPLLQAWSQRMQLLTSSPRSASFFQPWLRLAETTVSPLATVSSLAPPTLRATAFSGDVNVVGNLTLSPAARGTLELIADGAVNALQPAGTEGDSGGRVLWAASQINVSDANPASIPGVATPFGYQQFVGAGGVGATSTLPLFLEPVDVLFRESGSTTGIFGVIQTKQALHAPGPLHADDPTPLRIYADGGGVSGLTLFSPKATQIFASGDIQDVAFYIQNPKEEDTSIVASGRDIIPFRANAPLRSAANADGNAPALNNGPRVGDIQISGPGTLEVLAGRDLDLGTGANEADGTGVGITSIGNGRNPSLAFRGANIVAGAGIGKSSGLSRSELDFETFIAEYVEGSEYLVEIEKDLGGRTFEELTGEERNRVALEVFYRILRDTGRDFPETGNYDAGFEAIKALFGESKAKGDLLTRARDIRTRNGGDISLFAPGGKLLLANAAIGNPLTPPGIVTESGGNISIFTESDVDIGIGRIFTLRGGNQIIWSSEGDIAAGSSPKTVQSAPPTRVLIDPQSASVQTDLAGLATGGGIGVLATEKGISPGDVDLIAPQGSVDAGDAGIRVTGNLSIAAVQVLNADNIQVAGTSTGTPVAPVVAAPNFSGLAATSNATAATSTAAEEAAKQARTQPPPAEETPSVILVEAPGYDPGDESTEPSTEP